MAERAPAGLAGLVVADTRVGGVRGDEGFFHYRQYSAVDLARQCRLEDVWHLLHRGALPDTVEADTFHRVTVPDRRISAPVLSVLRAIATNLAEDTPALTWVRTGLSLVAAADGMRSWITSPRAELDAQRLIAVMPTVVAAMWRARAGLPILQPRDDLSMVENLLWMLEGEVPAPARLRALEQYLILTVDHGFNASTFAARVVASTGADVGAAVMSGLAALSGPLHGGAPTLVVDMLNEIGHVENARDWVLARLAGGDVIMGFGHRIYRTEDPRSELLREVAVSMGGSFVDLAMGVRAIVIEELDAHRPGTSLRTNVEYFAGVVLHELGIPSELYPALFAVSRTIGWTAHVLEQVSANKIIRPSSTYVGPDAPQPVPQQ